MLAEDAFPKGLASSLLLLYLYNLVSVFSCFDEGFVLPLFCFFVVLRQSMCFRLLSFRKFQLNPCLFPFALLLE